MDKKIKENFIKELSERIECDNNGFVKVKSLNEIIAVIDSTVVRAYKDRLRNLANISKTFITKTSQIHHCNTAESFVLLEELQALEYAIKLAEENDNNE